MSDSLQRHRLQPASLLCLWNSPDKNAGVGSHSLRQGIFLTQESNPGLQNLNHLSHHQGSRADRRLKTPNRLSRVSLLTKRQRAVIGLRFKTECCEGKFKKSHLIWLNEVASPAQRENGTQTEVWFLFKYLPTSDDMGHPSSWDKEPGQGLQV